MRTTDYASLKANIASMAIRTGDLDFENACDMFIQNAETRFSSDLRCREMEKFSSGLASADGYTTLPADFLSMRSVMVSNRGAEALEFVSPETYQAWMSNGWSGGHSLGYTIIGDQLRTYPASTGTVTMIYYQKIPPLTDLNPTNWLLLKYPSLYLYASLMEAMPFMKDDARAQLWQQFYVAGLAQANRDDTRARYGTGVMRVDEETP